MKTQKINIIETSDYEMFERLEGNRDITNVKKIIESINTVGYIPNPIIVNEKYEVIDGQNRLEALKQLQLPVFYYIVKGATIETARHMNLGQSNWKPIDYVKSYAEKGNTNYKRFLKLFEETNLTFQEVGGLLQNEIIMHGYRCRQIYSEGNFTVTEKEYQKAKETARKIEELKEVIKGIMGAKRTVLTALAWCLRVEGCNQDRFIKVLKKEYVSLKPVVETKDGIESFLRDISKIYNKGLAAAKKINFDVIYRDL